MTVEYRNATEPVANAGLSPKTRTAIAVTALLACLLVGGGIVYWLLVGSSPKKQTITVDPKDQGPAARTPVVMRQRRDAPGITRNDDEWVVRSATGEMRLRDKATSSAEPAYRFPDGLKLPPEQVSLLAGRFRILHDQAMAAEWKVTPQQVDKLRALQIGRAEMNPSSSQRDELWKLWTQYKGATGGQAKIDAQKKLIDKLDEVSKSLFEPARQQYTAKLEDIKKILTPEQVQIITKR
jgi:Spy/CpxP family protein refolding chaperone